MLQEDGLAASAAADDRQQFGAADVEREAAKDRPGAEGLVEIPDLDGLLRGLGRRLR
jgi:hypothetical protein